MKISNFYFVRAKMKYRLIPRGSAVRKSERSEYRRILRGKPRGTFIIVHDSSVILKFGALPL